LDVSGVVKVGGIIFIAEDPSFRSYKFLRELFNDNPERFIKHGLVPLQVEEEKSIVLKKIGI
jgi:hypothetical protein